MRGGAKVTVESHRHKGIFISRGKEDALVTKNLTPGEAVYGEKRISVEETGADGAVGKVEYRVWNPFRSKLAVADLVGPEGLVYAVEFSHRSGRDLVNMAKKRPNVIPIIEDARHPQKYRMLVGMVDCVFADV